MTLQSSRCRVAWLLVAVGLGAAGLGPGAGDALAQPAKAKEDEGVKKDVARGYVVEGDEALEKGDLPRALDRFERAELLIPAPTVRLRIGRVLARLGKLLEAKEKLALAAKTDLPSDAPAAFFKAVVEAQRELAALEPRIPRIEIVAPEGPAGATLDGLPLGDDAFAKPIFVNPLEHRITLPCCGTKVVTPKEGEVLKVVFTKPEKPPVPEAKSGGGPNFVFIGGLASLGVGVVSLGVGVFNTVKMSGLQDDFATYAVRYSVGQDVCAIASTGQNDVPLGANMQLTAAERGRVNDICQSAETAKLMQYVGYPLAAVGVGAGVVLLLLSPRSEKPAASRIEVLPVVGGSQTGVVVRGLF